MYIIVGLAVLIFVLKLFVVWLYAHPEVGRMTPLEFIAYLGYSDVVWVTMTVVIAVLATWHFWYYNISERRRR